MKIYFSVDPEVHGGESRENLEKMMKFLQNEKHKVYRAEYVYSDDRNSYLQKELGIKRDPTYTEQRALYMKWIDDSDVLLAEMSSPSEGRSMIIQRALDKPLMGMSYTPIILIKGKQFKRRTGKIVNGLIESDDVVYCEYDSIDDVIKSWPQLLNKAITRKCILI